MRVGVRAGGSLQRASAGLVRHPSTHSGRSEQCISVAALVTDQGIKDSEKKKSEIRGESRERDAFENLGWGGEF